MSTAFAQTGNAMSTKSFDRTGKLPAALVTSVGRDGDKTAFFDFFADGFIITDKRRRNDFKSYIRDFKLLFNKEPVIKIHMLIAAGCHKKILLSAKDIRRIPEEMIKEKRSIVFTVLKDHQTIE
jgi:hypothetical protein